MSAAVLREAAALIRKRAETATPGPWETWTTWDAEVVVSERGRRTSGIVCLPATGREDYGSGNQEHIAAWHPAVALAVANWLDDEADETECLGSVEWPNVTPAGSNAYVVALAYLGRDA